MKRRALRITLSVLVIAALVVAVNVAMRWQNPQPQDLIIEVTGTQGRAIEVWINADGNERKLKGTIPAEFAVDAHKLAWEVKRLQGPQEERFNVAIHTPSETNWGGSAEDSQVIRGGSIGPSGLRRKRAWLGRLYE